MGTGYVLITLLNKIVFNDNILAVFSCYYRSDVHVFRIKEQVFADF